MRCTLFSVAVPVLILLGASAQEATVLGRGFKKIDKPFDDELTALHDVGAVSLLKCNVECSVLPGCLALEYKRNTSHCTMYGHLGVTDGSPVSVGRVSDDACRYAILDTEEKGYTTFHVEGGEIHLKRYNVGRTWERALEMCKSDGATLVKIDTVEKQYIVRSLFNLTYEKTKEPWIGLRDTTRSNVYRWTDGSAPTYTKWYKGQPSFTYEGHDEDCVLILSQMFGSAWDDDDCSKIRWFVCEM